MPSPLMEPNIVAFAGDWHCNSRFAKQAIEYAALMGAEVIVHVGDFGYGFEPNWGPFADAVQGALWAHGLTLMGVDGNHENFDWLLDQPLDEASGLRPISDNIFHIPRGFRWDWGGVVFMGLGGAQSVDRHGRVSKRDWWEQELITDDDVKAAIEGFEGDRRRWAPKGDGSWGPDAGPVDVMITHDSPSSVPLPDGSNKGPGTDWPEDMLALSEANRQRLQSVVDKVTPKLVVHGHHHHRYSHLGASGLLVQGLDKDIRLVRGQRAAQLDLTRNMIFYSMDEIRDMVGS